MSTGEETTESVLCLRTLLKWNILFLLTSVTDGMSMRCSLPLRILSNTIRFAFLKVLLSYSLKKNAVSLGKSSHHLSIRETPLRINSEFPPKRQNENALSPNTMEVSSSMSTSSDASTKPTLNRTVFAITERLLAKHK